MPYSLVRPTRRVRLDKEQSAKTFYHRNQKPRLYRWIFVEISNHKKLYVFKATRWLLLVLGFFLLFFVPTRLNQMVLAFIVVLLTASLFLLLKKISLKNFLISLLFIFVELLIIFVEIFNGK
jgi:hypothetical protein